MKVNGLNTLAPYIVNYPEIETDTDYSSVLILCTLVTDLYTFRKNKLHSCCGGILPAIWQGEDTKSALSPWLSGAEQR